MGAAAPELAPHPVSAEAEGVEPNLQLLRKAPVPGDPAFLHEDEVAKDQATLVGG